MITHVRLEKKEALLKAESSAGVCKKVGGGFVRAFPTL